MIDNEYNKIWIKNGIMFAEYKPNTHVTLEMAKRQVNDRLELANGKAYPICGSIVNLKKVSNDAREFLGTDAAMSGVICFAIVTSNPLQKMFGNFYLNFRKSKIPTRLFSNQDEALQWISRNRFVN